MKFSGNGRGAFLVINLMFVLCLVDHMAECRPARKTRDVDEVSQICRVDLMQRNATASNNNYSVKRLESS